ncbi:unnamed protein product [Citrullus colocynthis]|uniref:Uncharacterized protein n=1 Tax=Citrullus colocynthis TaxID=252529 RepID=A0ABP0YEM3_9ROSI
MPFPLSMEARLLLLMAVITLLVSGDNKARMGVALVDHHPMSNMQEKHRKHLPSPSLPPPWSHSFNALFASKRKLLNFGQMMVLTLLVDVATWTSGLLAFL